MTVDWGKMAEPTAGGYDTGVVLEHAAAQGYRRPAAVEPTFLDGAVSLAHVYAGEAWSLPTRDAPAAVTPAIVAADRMLARTPVLREQVKALVFAIHPGELGESLRHELPDGGVAAVHGSSRSHSLDHRFGTLWSTVDCPFGLAQSIVHEMAHQKLRALGLPVEGCGVLVANPPSELYPSPILARDRPMSAVLHAAYSFAYVVELDLACAQSEDPTVRRVARQAIEKNLVRLTSGYVTMRRHLRLGRHGAEFFAGFFAWLERLVGRGHLELSLASAPSPAPPVLHAARPA